MAYSDYLSTLNRRRIDLLVIETDKCSRTFGVAPCTATGAKCYNTYPTCKDTSNYAKAGTGWVLKFINQWAPNTLIPEARPYILNVSSLPTELKESKTVVKRLKVTLADEPDDLDVLTDPYTADRTTIQGLFWKKWIQRNRNFKGRLLKLYEGFDGLAEADFSLKFVGKIENIELGESDIMIEAVDLLKSLDAISYPVQVACRTSQALYNEFEVSSQALMIGLPAVKNDWVKRTDAATITSTPFTGATDANGVLPGSTDYTVSLYAYFGNRAVATDSQLVSLGFSENCISISFTAFTSATKYRIWIDGATSPYDNTAYYETTSTSLTLGRSTDIGSWVTGDQPSIARYFQMTGTDPSSTGSWTETTSAYNLSVTDGSVLDASGYIKVEDEIIYYASKSSNTLQDITRGINNTKKVPHSSGVVIGKLFEYPADNPFTILQDILTAGGIDASYIAAKFGTYESAWSDIDFSLQPYFQNTKLGDIYFNLVDSLDCLSWVNEDGEIDIIKQEEVPGSYTTITDTENIIRGSISVDWNEESRFTRWFMYWNRYDGSKKLDDKSGYNRINLDINADAESAVNYNDEKAHITYSAFINIAGNEANCNTYVNTVLTNRETRTKQAQEILKLSVELKDSAIKVGDIIKVSTSALQDADGADYSEVTFRVIKKEQISNTIKLELLRYYA